MKRQITAREVINGKVPDGQNIRIVGYLKEFNETNFSGRYYLSGKVMDKQHSKCSLDFHPFFDWHGTYGSKFKSMNFSEIANLYDAFKNKRPILLEGMVYENLKDLTEKERTALENKGILPLQKCVSNSYGEYPVYDWISKKTGEPFYLEHGEIITIPDGRRLKHVITPAMGTGGYGTSYEVFKGTYHLSILKITRK